MFSWMNGNQGAIMALLTLVYVIATIVICYYNNKSAKVASQQLAAMKKSQIQNFKLTLFDRRVEIYSALKAWCYVVEQTFSNIATNPITHQLLGADNLFEIMTHYNIEHKELEDVMNQIQNLRISNDDDKDEQHTFLINKQSILLINIYGKTKDELMKTKFLFSNIHCEQIEKFAIAFFNTVMNIDAKNLGILKTSYNELMQANVLHQMEEQLLL